MSHSINSGAGQLDPWSTNPATFPPVSNSSLPVYNSLPSNPSGPSRHSSGNITPNPSYPEMPPAQPKPSSDPIIAFLAEMPSAADNPTRVAIWTELVRFKTRSLELLIAEAKRKEREAELELAKFKDLTAGGPNRISSAAPIAPVTALPTSISTTSLGSYNQPSAALSSMPLPTHIFPYYHSAQQSALPLPLQPQQQQQQQPQQTLPQSTTQNDLDPNPFLPQSMTPFDLHAITENFDDMFNWLPDFDQSGNLVDSGDPLGIDPNALHFPPDPNPTSYAPSPVLRKDSGGPVSTPIKRSASSGAESIEDEQPTAKKSKRTTGKKVTVEVSPSCTTCHKPMGKILVRAPQSEMPDTITTVFRCLDCALVNRPPPVGGDAGLGGPAIGTVETRKRQRMGMEAEDEDGRVRDKRQFCDVCQRVIGSGQVKGGRENIGYLAEIICASCDAKYQRCTDCGGGGGPRQGIGKWRLKQVFQPGRKTCSLSHSRLGDRQREIGVHVTPSDFTPAQFSEVIARCKALWQEKNLSRLAVPEMMEIDLPANVVNPLQSYADIENQITGNWPSRESMIRAEGANPDQFKRILGLTWAHARPRRGVRTVDLEEEHHKVEIEDEEDNSTVLDNIKKTNVVIPAGCELIGMWGGEWDIEQGSILVSTFIPFEGTDGEDSTALSVGEIITKVQTLQHEMNQNRKARHPQMALIPQVEHLWVVSGGSVPLVRERMADILIRKRSFVHVEEYLTRHPSFAKALQARPNGLHPTDGVLPAADGSRPPTKPLILVRWLGKDFNAQKIQEIKQMEFGGKTKPKKKAKAKA